MWKDGSFMTLNCLLLTTVSYFVKQKDENIFISNKLTYNWSLTD